ncbi:Ger(x)C family spore germination protein [Paenisporosarcina macmurdoensis]|uniref:Ger(X)C family spore germination protein n=1 Tax=Paenisporosarcina macmurdoensis TaxID=212659 RepID=A0ABW1LCA2_9BACL
MKRKEFLVVLSSILLLSGCAQQINQQSLEKLGLISVIAFDYVDDETMKMTVIMPQPAMEAEKHTQVFTVETDMLHKGLAEITTKAEKTVTLSQLRVVLFSEEFARKGKMKKLIELIYQDPDVRSNTYVGIVRDSAEKILTSEYPDKPNTSVYINNTFQPKPHTFYSPFTTIHDFVFDETNPLLDSIAPYVELKDELISVEGIAAFKDGGLTYVFTLQQGLYVQMLRGQNKLSILSLNFGNDSSKKEKVVLEFIESKSKITSNHDLESPKLTITLKFEGTLSEYEGEKKLEEKQELAKLEKQISDQIEDDAMKMLQKSQELSIDPIGLFESFRMRYKGDWPSDLTEELLAKAEFKIEAETKILGVGSLK